ncbi:MAG: hypothetical protein ACXVKD_16815, partial [Candidatus Angelobacter sp.]
QGACSSSQAQHFAEVRQILTAQLSEPEAHFRRFPHAWVVRVDCRTASRRLPITTAAIWIAKDVLRMRNRRIISSSEQEKDL